MEFFDKMNLLPGVKKVPWDPKIFKFMRVKVY